MDAYYRQRAQLPHFGSYRRQRGSGIGALALGLSRFAIPFGRNVALPFIRKVALPAAKRLGRELLKEGLPELVDVVSKRQTPKQALKRTVSKTVRRQIGSGKRSGRKRVTKKKQHQKRRKIISKSRPLKRSRSDFFKKLRND